VSRPLNAAAEYEQLMKATLTDNPECVDDARFLLDRDDVHDQELVYLRSICRRCPLEQLCHAYARKAKPPAGMWAGRHYPPPKIRSRS
jgi:hypothetical protein